MTEWTEFDNVQEVQQTDLPPERDLWVADDLDDTEETTCDLPADEPLWLEESDLSNADKAADYLRSIDGQEQLADYVQRHYDDSQWDFSPDRPIPLVTRNQSLEGCTHPAGVEFTRQEVDMGDGVTISGVFPNFESRFDIDLGVEAKSMTLPEQFAACRERFQDHMYDDPKILSGLTLGDMDHLNDGYTPAGCSPHHGPRPGTFHIVDSSIHGRVGHTGGNVLWPPVVRKRN